MRIFWLGHSCFHILPEDGPSVLTDPFDEAVGYRLPQVEADIVTVSHNHHDHNNVAAVKGKPAVVRGPGQHSVLGVDFKGIETYHDEAHGKLRGSNTIFCFQLDKIRFCHLGDLGHSLSEKEVSAIGSVDMLFIPVGGVYTIDSDGAHEVENQLSPRITLPMHYHTKALTFYLDRVDGFIKDRDYEGPRESLQLKKEDLQRLSKKIILLEYPRTKKAVSG
ncbi:MAG: MBL fold metallo-hydrolase [Methanotrichaceae archaeon]|nr:MBL fold metallo-hydrolase [Methanotrichaceae archaeon]